MGRHKNWTPERRVELTSAVDAKTPADDLVEQFGMPINKIIKEAKRVGGDLEYLGIKGKAERSGAKRAKAKPVEKEPEVLTAGRLIEFLLIYICGR